jgi:hypothetical protein
MGFGPGTDGRTFQQCWPSIPTPSPTDCVHTINNHFCFLSVNGDLVIRYQE